jgi:hypothetical protein
MVMVSWLKVGYGRQALKSTQEIDGEDASTSKGPWAHDSLSTAQKKKKEKVSWKRLASLSPTATASVTAATVVGAVAVTDEQVLLPTMAGAVLLVNKYMCGFRRQHVWQQRRHCHLWWWLSVPPHHQHRPWLRQLRRHIHGGRTSNSSGDWSVDRRNSSNDGNSSSSDYVATADPSSVSPLSPLPSAFGGASDPRPKPKFKLTQTQMT